MTQFTIIIIDVPNILNGVISIATVSGENLNDVKVNLLKSAYDFNDAEIINDLKRWQLNDNKSLCGDYGNINIVITENIDT